MIEKCVIEKTRKERRAVQRRGGNLKHRCGLVGNAGGEMDER